MSNAMITVSENAEFIAQAKGILSEQEISDTITMIAANPMCGDLIRGTGGIRKVRVALSGRGKSGGARVVYYFRNADMPIYMLAVFAKNEKDNLSNSDRNHLKKFVEATVTNWKKRHAK